MQKTVGDGRREEGRFPEPPAAAIWEIVLFIRTKDGVMGEICHYFHLA